MMTKQFRMMGMVRGRLQESSRRDSTSVTNVARLGILLRVPKPYCMLKVSYGGECG